MITIVIWRVATTKEGGNNHGRCSIPCYDDKFIRTDLGSKSQAMLEFKTLINDSVLVWCRCFDILEGKEERKKKTQLYTYF